MDELSDDQRSGLEELRRAIAEQEPVRAAAIAACNAKVRAALQELHEAAGPFFGLLHRAERLHSEVEWDIRVAVEEARVWGRDEEAGRLEAWGEAWEEIGEGLILTDDDKPRTMRPPKPPISEVLAKLPLRPEGVEARPAGDRAIDPGGRAAVESSCRRIDAWLGRVAPGLAPGMNPGASPEAIAATEKELGLELPEAVRASYLVHDGSGIMGLFPAGDYLSLEQMCDEYAKWTYLVEEGGLDDEDSNPAGPIRKVHCHPQWIPIADRRSGDHMLIDLAPAEDGRVGQLINFSHETGPEDVAAPGLAEYLAYLADGLEGGAATIGEETYLVWDDERDTPRSGYVLPAGASPPAATPTANPAGAVRRYFESTEGGSGKFWEVACEGRAMTTRWGKLGSNGQAKTKEFDGPEKAAAEARKIIAQKVKEGYVEKPR